MRYLLIIPSLIFTLNFAYSQDQLILKNGEIVTGVVTAINKEVVRIDSDDAGRVKRYTDRDVEKAIIFIDDKEVEFTYETVPFLGKVLLGKLYDGKVDLYTTQTYVPGGEDHTKPNNYRMGGQWSMYYMKKDKEDDFFDLNYDGVLFNKFHNRVSKYFNDCPSLSKKIKNKEFKMENLEEIAKTYNSCE
ncbi:hypothetical protein [Christiangramia forsetii]|uniref:Secreted protein n=2 Tax=Christiangramia forsetii TaxID=411153 RepID=A0M619_CHRFK|nr:hypothetical protein [Christiangramia forsetii]GGG31618.1 hypothetical protein GCM10011532_13900 [Christiangramia forsetii]CAL68064.1 secreted protein [Christiangramia forsetii KT0803]